MTATRLALLATLLVGTLIHAQAPPHWPDTFNSRVQALALIQTLNAEILASRSATATLETTETPFGRAVQGLEPCRQTFATRMLWSPLPAGWEMPSGGRPAPTGRALAIADELFEHRAVLTLAITYRSPKWPKRISVTSWRFRRRGRPGETAR